MKTVIHVGETITQQSAFIMKRRPLMVSNSVNRRTDIMRDIDFLCASYPKAFSRQLSGIRPLKHDIIEDLIIELGDETFRSPMRRAISMYSHRPHYLKKVTTGKWRRDLHGNRIALVTDDEKRVAQAELDRWYARRAYKREGDARYFAIKLYPMLIETPDIA